MDTVDTRSASVPEDGEKIIEIQLERLRTFKNHPFKVRMDQEMIRLSASVEKYGIINPLIVRPIPDGVYEIISGHRRKAAAEKFGYRKVPVIIRVMSDDEAVINMVDSVRQLSADGSSMAVDRSRLKLVQTPQTFRADVLKRAYSQDFTELFTDDASVVEASGVSVALVPGNRENIKITTPFDLKIAEALLKE